MSRRDELLKVWTEHKNIGHVPCLFTDYNFLRHPKYVQEKPEGRDGYDGFGCHWTFVPEEKSSMLTPGIPPVCPDVTEWKQYVKFPDLLKYDWESCGAEETATWDRENKIPVVMLINGPFERSQHLLGFENALMAMFEEPEAYAELINAIADFKIQQIELIGKYYKPDVIMCHDDFGANDRMMMSLENWRKFMKEPTRRIVQAVHAQGCAYEHHTCGHIEPLIPEFIEIGMDAFNPLQRPCNDIQRIKDTYHGQITMVGGYNTQGVLERPGTTEEERKEEFRDAYRILAPGGGYAALPLVIDMAGIAPSLVAVEKELGDQF